MEPKTTTLHPTCFKITAMHSVCCYNLLGWRSFWNVPPSLMDWPGWQFYSLFGQSNTNLVEDLKILLPVKFRWIPFSGFRSKANQRPGRPYCFLDQPEKHKFGRGCWELAFCQVSLNSVQWFHSRSRKCLIQSEDRAAIFFFWSVRKNASLVEDVRILLPSSFVEFYSAVSEEKLKMSQQIIDRGGHFVFPIHLKNTDLV